MDKDRKKSTPAAAPADAQIFNLTKEQELAARLWKLGNIEEISAAVGVPPEIIEGWKDQPRFLAEIAGTRTGIKVSHEQKQAAALIFSNTSYPQAEAKIGLSEGSIIEWAEDENSAFNALLNEMAYLTCPSEYLEPEPKALSDDQVKAIPLILEGNTDAEVGESIGKARETVNRWRNHDLQFQRQLEAARSAFYDSQVAAVTARAQKAIAVLDGLLDSEDEKIRLQAVNLLLKLTPSLKEANAKSTAQDLRVFKELSDLYKLIGFEPKFREEK